MPFRHIACFFAAGPSVGYVSVGGMVNRRIRSRHFGAHRGFARDFLESGASDYGAIAVILGHTGVSSAWGLVATGVERPREDGHGNLRCAVMLKRTSTAHLDFTAMSHRTTKTHLSYKTKTYVGPHGRIPVSPSGAVCPSVDSDFRSGCLNGQLTAKSQTISKEDKIEASLPRDFLTPIEFDIALRGWIGGDSFSQWTFP